MRNVIEVLQERGFIEAMTSDELLEFANKPLKVYCGFDPTADSLHIGSLVPIIGLAWFQRYGHQPVAIVGGATGMIGDPSGKNSERQFLDENTIEKNLKGIRRDLEAILKGSDSKKPVEILNNYDWYKSFSVIEFLRDVGKNFRLGTMLAKDSVKNRLASEEGLSFTELSYQVLQGYDFYYLFKNDGVTLQIGGSDQWGNITAGTELIRKVLGKSAQGLTFPLLTKSDGQKFGKSEKGAIWLSPEKLSPYEFYQYLFRTADADVIKLMRLLTFMDMAQIRAIEREMQEEAYIPNTAQRRLAEEVTRIVHGEAGLRHALRATVGACPGKVTDLDANHLEKLALEIPTHLLSLSHCVGNKLVDVIVAIGLQSSKGEAKRLIHNGGVYINNDQVQDENYALESHHLIDGRFILLAVGKKNKVLLRVEK